MIEITNRLRGPLQLIVKSRVHNGNFSTLTVPGMGAGKNVIYIEDEEKTDHIDLFERNELIFTKYVKALKNMGE